MHHLIIFLMNTLLSIAYADEGAYYGSKGLTIEAIKQHQQQTQQEERELKAIEQSNRLQERQLRQAQIREEQEENDALKKELLGEEDE
ncbi:MAG: hypothetical protein QX195_01240 [Methylococcaceae bacterium]|jgi:hypothetical protein